MKRSIASFLLFFAPLLLIGGLMLQGPQLSLMAPAPKPIQVNGLWPPQINKPYPNLELVDQDGKPFNLSSYKGKVIIVEPIGMSCAACQAFSGAHLRGTYPKNITAQSGLESIHQMFPHYTGGMKLPNREIVFLQLLLYDPEYQNPTPEDAALWAKHFGFKKSHNQIVAVPKDDLRGPVAFNLIPGFQLIDRNLVLRSDSTGHKPHDNLYTRLLPMVPAVLNKPPRN